MQQLKSRTLLHGRTYRIVKMLGQGSFGITYLAEHTSLGKKFAIKEFFMKDINSRDEDGTITGISDGSLSYYYAQKFRKEAMNLADMEHMNIVRVTDSFDENGTFYYVMDYIEGQNLNEYLKDHVLSESEAISIIKDVANALMYMHEEKHMLHLDLKPGNIMRRASDGHIFLIDFGLSKHFDVNGAPETSTNIGLGTPGYAPTEQGDKVKSGEFRPTIDVYALGATLFKLLTRETPPTASEVVNDDEILAEILSNNSVSQNIINLVVKAMMPGYRKRIQTARKFKDILSEGCNSSAIYKKAPQDNSENENIIKSQIEIPSNSNSQFDNHQELKIENPKQENSAIDSDDDDYELPWYQEYRNLLIAIAAICLFLCYIFYSCLNTNTEKFYESTNEIVDTISTEDSNMTPTEDSNKDIIENKEIKLLDLEEDEVDRVYDVVEQMPSFPGGQTALTQYLSSHVTYPAVAEKKGIEGRVTVKFVVEKDGSITGVMTTKSVDPSLDREVERVIKSMPKWIPGKHNDVPVRVQFFVPVVFRLQ